MLNTSNNAIFGSGYGNSYVHSAQPVQIPQPMQMAQPVYPSQYLASQQYGTQQDQNVYQPGFIIVHDENEAMDPKYPLKTPLFNDMEDVFYFKQLGPDNMHTVLKKARFVWEDDNVVDATPALIEQKDITYGDSPKNEEIENLKKSIEDLAGQVSTLVELQLEQQTTPDKTTRNSSAQKKSSTNK